MDAPTQAALLAGESPTERTSGYERSQRSWRTLFNPMRHYLEIVRTIFLKGAGLKALWVQYLALTLMRAGILSFAAARFQRRIG